jgi:transposase
MVPPPRRRELTEGERGEIIGMRKAGMSFAAIGRELSVHEETVRKVWIYYESTGEHKPLPRQGRPTILKEHDRRIIKRHITKNREGRREPLGNITEKFNLDVCVDTLAKELNKLGLYHRTARKKPYITEQQRIKRLQFAKDCQDFGYDEWSRVLFSDEMGIQTGSNDRKVWVWRMKGEEYHPDCIEPTFIPGFKRIKIWGAIRHGQKSKLVIINEDLEKDHKFNAEAYLNEILDGEFYDFWMEAMEDHGYVFVMEDGASSHQGVAVVRKKELEEFGWEGWGPGTWPSNSPDLNPIENVWHMLKAAIRKRPRQPQTEADLIKAVKEEWEKLDIDKINKLILTMPERLAEVRRAKGGPSRY